MRICKTKSGEFIEAQSSATEGTLISNAVNCGFDAEEIVESEITEAEFESLMENLADQSLTYADKRKAEYPPMIDYLDGIVKGDQAQVDKYIADCLAVKQRYPKNDGGDK